MQLEAVLTERWKVCLKERRVCSKPHVLVRTYEAQSHDCYIEIYALTGCFAMEYPSDRIRQLDAEAAALCESRNDQLAVAYPAVTMLAPRVVKSKD